MSFFTPTNQTWVPSSAAVTVTDNTDYSIDGSSKKLVWSDGANETVTVSFDSITLSDYEELVFYLDQRAMLTPGDIFKIEIDSNEFEFEKPIGVRGWHHIKIDCSAMGSITEIVITSLVAELYLFIDVLGVRKVPYTSDIDIMLAFKEAISLDYDVSTTLSADLDASDTSISLTSSAYINNTSILEIDDGVNTAEVQLVDKSGTLVSAPGTAFSSGDTVNVLCPTLMADHDDMQPDPVCGISFYDKLTGNNEVGESLKNGYAQKLFVGALGVVVYIDCESEKKLLQLAREYDYNYGERFNILLDGEVVFILLETTLYVDGTVGNNPRIAYYYMVEPQPYTVAKMVLMTTVDVTVESEPVSSILD